MVIHSTSWYLVVGKIQHWFEYFSPECTVVHVHTYIAHTTFASRFSNDFHHISNLFVIH